MTKDAAHGLVSSHPGVLLHEDVDLIQELVGKLSKSRYVEVVDLGAGSGTTALSVLCARPKKIRVITIDHDQKTLRWPERVAINVGRREDWRGILADSVEAAKRFETNSVDLLLVDTDHTYETTKRELEAWLPKIRKDGYIWLHDYGVASEWGWRKSVPEVPGVKQAVEEAVVAGELELVEIGGLGWAGRKPKEKRSGLG